MKSPLAQSAALAPQLEDQTCIPKRIIHIYCAPAGRPDVLPLACRASLASSKQMHPEYEHFLFNTERMEKFIDEEFPEHRKVIDSFRFPIQRFDFFRYLAIYRLGGFYFDLDVYFAEKLDPLLNCHCVFPFEELTISEFLRQDLHMDWEIANYGFGAAPGSPFIKAIIDNCVRGLMEPTWGDQMMRDIPRWARKQFFVPMTTGPGMVSRTFAEHPELHKDITILFPPDVCEPSTWHRVGEFGVHLMQASWRKKDNFIRAKLSRIWEARKRRRLEAQSRNSGPLRRGDWKAYP